MVENLLPFGDASLTTECWDTFAVNTSGFRYQASLIIIYSIITIITTNINCVIELSPD